MTTQTEIPKLDWIESKRGFDKTARLDNGEWIVVDRVVNNFIVDDIYRCRTKYGYSAIFTTESDAITEAERYAH